MKDVLIWLSFCDPAKPVGQQFLGVVIARAPDFGAAIAETWRLGINPGGEVVGFVIPEGISDSVEPYANNLLTRDVAHELSAVIERASAAVSGVTFH